MSVTAARVMQISVLHPRFVDTRGNGWVWFRLVAAGSGAQRRDSVDGTLVGAVSLRRGACESGLDLDGVFSFATAMSRVILRCDAAAAGGCNESYVERAIVATARGQT